MSEGELPNDQMSASDEPSGEEASSEANGGHASASGIVHPADVSGSGDSSNANSVHAEAVKTDRPISEYVRIESLILSTPSADAYRAFDENQKQSCSLWISRTQLEGGDDEILRYLRKLESVDQIDPPICSLSGYGVDCDGRAFALFPPLDGYKVSAGNLEGAEGERRFTTCLRLVSILHSRGISLGDLSADSFWVTRDGELLIVGLIGILTDDPRSAVAQSPASALPFLAPEIRERGMFDPRADVFSLGVLGYHLLSGQFPYGEMPAGGNNSVLTSINEVLISPPVWTDELTTVACSIDPDERYEDAGAMLRALNEIRARASEDDSMPTVRRKSSKAIQVAGNSLPGVQEKKDYSPAVVRRKTTGVPASQVILMLLMLVVLGASLLFMFPVMSPETPIDNSVQLEKQLKHVLEAVGDEPIAKDLEGLADPNVSLREKEKYLAKLAESDDPFAHDALMKSAMKAPNVEFRAVSEKAILERAKRQGLTRSAEQIRLWLRTLRPREYPPAYEPLLQVLDVALPIEERFSALRRSYSSNPTVGLRLATALAFDLEALEDFQPLLSQLVGDSLRLNNASSRGAITLIMAHPDLSQVFGEDVLQVRSQVPNEDITWLMKRLAVQGDIHVRAIANLALERELVSPTRSLFLELVRDRADLTPSLITALIRAAAGGLTEEDIASFGRWYDVQSEGVLLAVLVDLEDPKLSRQAIETLAGKSLIREPAASVVEWVRRTQWERREKFSQLVGILGNLDRVSPDQVAEELKLLDAMVKDSDLLDILLDTDNPIIVSTVVTKYGDLLGLGTLLLLLDSREQKVRIEAIRALKDFNDLGALKIILDHYNREKDPIVREVYKETFWVIRKREAGEGGLLAEE